MSVIDTTKLEGQALGKYQVLRKLGEGNMAVVYLAQDPFIDRPVAIKVARAEKALESGDPVAFKRLFFNEAQTAGMLRHPNITSIYDAGMEHDVYYIVMEYVHEGRTLEHFTSAKTLFSLEDITNILYQCALALDYAHRRGVIHRDIKPRNILLTPTKEVKVSDFGVAVVQSRGEIAKDQAGSPLYMSPEQIRNEPLTGQSDLFSLGIVAYELLTGTHPFTGGNLESINHQTLTKKPLPLAEYRANTPDIYQRIIEKALAKAPYYRYKSGSDLAGDIALVFDFLRDSPHQISPQEKFSKARGLRFFADFQEPELWEIINAAEWIEVTSGHEIIHEGEFDPSFFVIVDGTVVVIKNDNPIIELVSGDCFGEMGLTTGRRRSATIKAKQALSVIKIRSSVIDRTSVNCQLRFQRNFLNALVERLELATDQLANRGPVMTKAD